MPMKKRWFTKSLLDIRYSRIQPLLDFRDVMGSKEYRDKHWSPMVDGLNEGEMENPYAIADIIRGNNPPE
tara:strand:+ start:3598 stop:3807 length:210 start_codon:yes stop_codon:yes gene_type:complete